MHRKKQYDKNQRKKRILTVFLLLMILLGLFIQNRLSASSQNQATSQNIHTLAQVQNASASSRILDQSAASAPDASAWNLILVNSTNPVPKDFSIQTAMLDSGQAVDSRIYQPLQNMLDAAEKEGLSPLICSSYRTEEFQSSLYQAQVDIYINRGYSKKEAEKQAAIWVAPPGTSEHQLGLAVDIVSASYQMLDEAQENTKEQKWLMKHCAEFGFILRYPNDKSDITGIGYEPWHYRYVGKAAAKEIMERGICLEEYLLLN